MDWSFIAIIIQLIFLEGILSLDNAAVLGVLVSDLPDDAPVYWPQPLRGLGKTLKPVLGHQRTAALRAGLLGAYVGRGMMLFLATLIVQNPWLKLLGAAYLIHLAFSSLGSNGDEEGGEEGPRKRGNTFWMIVLTVEMTDLIFSLDNVVAAVTLSTHFWVVFLGVAIGILMMRFAAGWFSYAVQRQPVLKHAAYILILIIGFELVYSEISGVDINEWLRFGISVSAILLCLVYARLPFRERINPILHWISRGFGHVNSLVDWVLEPLFSLLRHAGSRIAGFFTPSVKREGEAGD